jgi:hypothetical protein
MAAPVGTSYRIGVDRESLVVPVEGFGVVQAIPREGAVEPGSCRAGEARFRSISR